MSQRTKQGPTNPSELLEISDDNLLPDESQISGDDDNAVKFKRNPLALITNNKKGNVIRNNTLADLNKASGRSFDNNFHVNNSNSSCLHSPNITHINNPPCSSITPINYNNSRSNIDNPPHSSITPINYNNSHLPFDNDVDFRPNNALFNSNNTFQSNNSSYNNASYALPASFTKWLIFIKYVPTGVIQMPKQEDKESEIIIFIDESLMKDLLQRWLNMTNMSELKAQDSLNTLQRFVCKALIINYVSGDTDSTKSLDRLTKDIAVPSQNGKNVASNLQL
ncbi:hypothetical protein C1645_829388 [Glomus cerebriforme]|uniref:Uncharacterized protein n=1 Tax=Glomus cerebriforme TaxID=658196 RepID=A0A397SN88_9GLOM|nr:hypothetical protein C1645_829388 [Glomus cerebriforme]